MHTEIWSGNLKEMDYLGDLVVGERIILKRILEKRGCEDGD
jgi:hypothetical protein